MDATVAKKYSPKDKVLGRLGVEGFPDYKAMIAEAFAQYDPGYPKKQPKAEKEYRKARAAVMREEKHINDHCPVDEKIRLTTSRHIRIEAKWYVEETAYFTDFDNEIDRLYTSLENHDQPQDIAWQNPTTGAFGSGYTQFHAQCDAMIEGVYTLYNDGDPIAAKVPFYFMEPISTPEKMTAYLTPLITSNIAGNGINHRDQIGAITGSVSQLVYKSYLRKYIRDYVEDFEITDAYRAAWTKLLDHWQDPATGFWGEWFVFNGELYKSPDLSLTYHTVKYRMKDGDHPIQYLEEMIDTLFAIEKYEYPFGWMVDGHMNNHNNMDVVKILKLVWDDLTQEQMDYACIQFEKMLDYCLNDSMDDKGGFRFFPFYNSLGDAYYYGVAFLDQIGYLNPDNRFWTDQTFPGWQETGCGIKKRLQQLGLNNRRAESAMEILDQDVPDC